MLQISIQMCDSYLFFYVLVKKTQRIWVTVFRHSWNLIITKQTKIHYSFANLHISVCMCVDAIWGGILCTEGRGQRMAWGVLGCLSIFCLAVSLSDLWLGRQTASREPLVLPLSLSTGVTDMLPRWFLQDCGDPNSCSHTWEASSSLSPVPSTSFIHSSFQVLCRTL